MNSYAELWRQLTPLYADGEARAIVRLLLDAAFGLSLSDVLCGKVNELSATDQARLAEMMRRLADSEPVQYVLGEAEFGPLRLKVTPSVLIPRPETLELCEFVCVERGARSVERGANILDIGTGSGCIAVYLAHRLPDADVEAWDISADALAVAAENARRAHVNITFRQVDILAPRPSSLVPRPSNTHPPSSLNLPPSPKKYTAIVSNPPYICNKERAGMEPNVLRWEPHGALFVPDDDPLLFYRAIGRLACDALTDGGALYLEINPLYADALTALLSDMGLHDVTARADQFGRRRFIKAVKK